MLSRWGLFDFFFNYVYGASWFVIWVWLWSLGFLIMKSLFAVMFVVLGVTVMVRGGCYLDRIEELGRWDGCCWEVKHLGWVKSA